MTEGESKRKDMGLIYSKRFLLTTITFLICSASFPTKSSSDKPTAYEVLESYNFPVGLLPKGVTGYELDDSTGKFSSYLNASCDFSLKGSYQVNYQSTIKGYISNGKLSSLEGVKVKCWFFWISIIEVKRVGNQIDFSFGIGSAGFPVDNFVECPQCGCGLDCISSI